MALTRVGWYHTYDGLFNSALFSIDNFDKEKLKQLKENSTILKKICHHTGVDIEEKDNYYKTEASGVEVIEFVVRIQKDLTTKLTSEWLRIRYEHIDVLNRSLLLTIEKIKKNESCKITISLLDIFFDQPEIDKIYEEYPPVTLSKQCQNTPSHLSSVSHFAKRNPTPPRVKSEENKENKLRKTPTIGARQG